MFVLAAVIVGVARFAGSDDDRAATPETSPPETSVPTSAPTTLAPTTVAGGANASSSTTRPATTTSTASAAYVNGRMGVVFGEKVAFRLYVFDTTMLRGYVDTGTGQLINAASSVPADQVFAGSETRLFVFNSRTHTLSTIDRNLRETPTSIALDVNTVFPSTNGKLWAVVDRPDSNNAFLVQEFTSDGFKSSELTIQAPFTVRGSLGGSIVTAAAGQIFLHDPKTARVTQYAVGDLMAMTGSRGRVVGLRRRTLVPRVCRRRHPAPPVDRRQRNAEARGVLGRVAFTHRRRGSCSSRQAPGPSVVELRHRARSPPDCGRRHSRCGCPDGKWLFNMNSSPPQAIDVQGGRALDLSLSAPDRSPFRVVPLSEGQEWPHANHVGSGTEAELAKRPAHRWAWCSSPTSWAYDRCSTNTAPASPVTTTGTSARSSSLPVTINSIVMSAWLRPRI